MESKIQKGYLLLADISGYTSFLATTEIEHSQEILSEFLNIIIEKLRSVFTLAEVEGDAVFVYTPESRINRGETLLEVIEDTYFTFVQQKDIMNAKTTCQCNACRQIPNLDLKFITVYGDYIIQNVAGSSKPVGSDVNLAHRLLKNKVADSTGWNGYALFTDKTLERITVATVGYNNQVENYEHLGDVNTYSYNLKGTLDKIAKQKDILVKEDEAHVHKFYDFDFSPAELWEILHDNSRRGEWMVGTRWEKGSRIEGRTAVGAKNHCFHGKGGKGSSVEEIIAWKPFEYYTCRQKHGVLTLLMTFILEPRGSGTRIHNYSVIHALLPNFIRKILTIYGEKKKAKFDECWANIDNILKKDGKAV